MQKIAFVIPYFTRGGGMPNHFPLWLLTAGWNSDVDFFLFTDADIHEYDIPQNVIWVPMSWEEIVSLFQSNFEFKIALETPYKLCDFKPSYGEVFANYLQEYDFWGYCDIDLFWGKIRRFVTDEIMTAYDRIYSRGHCCLFRNNSTVNSWYRVLPSNGYQKWKHVFSIRESRCFDEWAGHCGGGISMIMKANGIPIYDETDMADLNVTKGYFLPNRKKYPDMHIFFHLNTHGCFVYNESGLLDEVVYVHFQKRKLEITLDENIVEFYFSAPNNISNKPQADIIGVRIYEIAVLGRRIVNNLKSFRLER